MLNQSQITALIDAVRDVARDEIMPLFRALPEEAISTKSGPDDLVTLADQRAETALEARISRILPGAGFVGEESVAADPTLLDRLDGAGLTVIVDPIDGTSNFVSGLATFGVILAVMRGPEVIFGLLYDPVLDDWIMATPGGGAWMCRPQDAPRRLSMTDGPLTGFLPFYYLTKPAQTALAPLMPAFDRTASLRCSLFEYRLLADNQARFGVGVDPLPWDHAAGSLIVAEAGGVVAFLDGAPYAPARTKGVLLAAATQEIWDRVAALLAPLDLTR